ncbi:hypothetical protein B0H14DRAFT_3640945 [Mycena olivaceomarginata]|nr:hypothetical protein B0H14DRAFT_3640945 [Mycena olivaceomarginata]
MQERCFWTYHPTPLTKLRREYTERCADADLAAHAKYLRTAVWVRKLQRVRVTKHNDLNHDKCGKAENRDQVCVQDPPLEQRLPADGEMPMLYPRAPTALVKMTFLPFWVARASRSRLPLEKALKKFKTSNKVPKVINKLISGQDTGLAEEIAKQYVKNKRRNAYKHGWLEVPAQYAYLKDNSAKRDQSGSRKRRAAPATPKKATSATKKATAAAKKAAIVKKVQSRQPAKSGGKNKAKQVVVDEEEEEEEEEEEGSNARMSGTDSDS